MVYVIVFFAGAVKLVGGDNPNEGRAMFYKDGEWGTICDATVGTEDWASVFCNELGYDHASHAVVSGTV